MKTYPSRLAFISGLIVLILTVVNWIYAVEITPFFERAEILAGMSGVGIMLISFIWSEVVPIKPDEQYFDAVQGLKVSPFLNEDIKNELGWGTHMILTASSAVSVLVYWDNEVLIQRGLFNRNKFKPGKICFQCSERGKPISLVSTKHYPDAIEFNTILTDIPSLYIYPLNSRGWLIIAGAAERCFNKNDIIWFDGWSAKLTQIL